MNPSDVSTTAESPAQPVAPVMSTALENANSDAKNLSSEFSAMGVANSAVQAAPPRAVDRPSETSKKVDAPKAKGANEELNVKVDDPNLPAGGVVVEDTDTDGKTTTIRLMPNRPLPNMQRPAPPAGTFGMPPGMDLSSLTPAQRQKVLRAMRNAEMQRRRVNQVAPPLQPRPTP